MADLAGKQAEAERLRSELSSLRIRRENGLQETHNDLQEKALDAEIERLRSEVERERAQYDTDGSPDAAIAAMRADDLPGEPVLVSDVSMVEEPSDIAPATQDVDEQPSEETEDVQLGEVSDEEK